MPVSYHLFLSWDIYIRFLHAKQTEQMHSTRKVLFPYQETHILIRKYEFF